MKKYLGLFIFFAVIGLMLATSVVNAEDGDSNRVKPTYNIKENNKREAFKEDMKDNREDFIGEVKGRKEDFREKMQAERKAFLDKLKTERESFMQDLKAKREEFRSANVERKRDFWNKAKDMIARRFEMAIERLENAQGRVGEIIDKLKTDGEDTGNATEALDLSKQKLRDAKVKIYEIKSLLPATTGDSITPEVFEKIKLLAREAKDLLKESKEALRDSIKAIKDLRNDKEDDDKNKSSDDN